MITLRIFPVAKTLFKHVRGRGSEAVMSGFQNSGGNCRVKFDDRALKSSIGLGGCDTKEDERSTLAV